MKANIHFAGRNNRGQVHVGHHLGRHFWMFIPIFTINFTHTVWISTESVYVWLSYSQSRVLGIYKPWNARIELCHCSFNLHIIYIQEFSYDHKIHNVQGTVLHCGIYLRNTHSSGFYLCITHRTTGEHLYNELQ